MNRRNFVWAASAAARVHGANNRIRVGVIGSGGRGRLHIAEFKEVGAEVGGIADVYEPNLTAGLKIASTGAKGFDNYRRLLDDKSFDAVVVATPDHWHARMTIDAVEAGKDVYVEKPLAHTIEEGERIVAAVRRTRRVVQVGTQRRSYELFQEGKSLFDSGVAGTVRLVNAWWYNHQSTVSTQPLAGKLDWQQWLGSAPQREIDPARFRNWYYYYEYSGGLMIGQAAHVIDAIHWFMNSTEPLAVTCAGGQVNLPGVEIPETTCMTIEYPENYLAVFTVGYKAMRYNGFLDQCKQFHGDKARFDMAREWYAVYPQSNALELQASAGKKMPGTFGSATRSHIRNFLECVRSRKDPNATVENGQSTNIVLCMAIDALRSGRRQKWNRSRRRVEV